MHKTLIALNDQVSKFCKDGGKDGKDGKDGKEITLQQSLWNDV